MDKTAIKNYAVEARRKLIEAVKVKAGQLYIFEDSAKTLTSAEELQAKLLAEGVHLDSNQLQARTQLYNEIRKSNYNRVIENVACTWFNRLIALRIMEVNDWLPSNIRILSSHEPGRAEPDAMREIERLDYVNQSKISELQAAEGNILTATEKLYKYILMRQCIALSGIMPGLFPKEHDYTELLLPDLLLAKGGIIHDLVNGAVDESNFKIKSEDAPDNKGQIEIIGWLYQSYISEKKDEVFAGLKKNIKINKDTISAATQLFTPEWIVKYMVENSLGRLWLESHPNADLQAKWRYYLPEDEQEPEAAAKLNELRAAGRVGSPEHIRLIDPCMGSGHILVYAFDVLFQIYQSEGYAEREIPNLILTYNLYGLDIDDRAGQLAYFALIIKARSYNRRFFRQDSIPQPQVYSPKNDEELQEYGSLLKVDGLDAQPVEKEGFLLEGERTYEEDLNTWNYKRLLSQKYDVVITNPPYLSPTPSQTDWVKKNYPDSKSDLCVVFIERNFNLLKQSGYLSMITMHSWMFLSSYEKFREKLIATKDIVNMAHLGARAFEEIGGEVVQTTAFVGRSSSVAYYLATYVRLVDFAGQNVKEEAFLRSDCKYIANKSNFEKIPGCPIAYWASENLFIIFEGNKSIGELMNFKKGMSTGDNSRFIRFWYEVIETAMNLSCNKQDSLVTRKKWFPINSGGGYRKWYGNNIYVVNWLNSGEEMKANAVSLNHGGHWSRYIVNTDKFFVPGITWNAISSTNFGARIFGDGFLFSSASMCGYGSEQIYIIALLNSVVCKFHLCFIAPTLNFGAETISKIPIIKKRVDEVEKIIYLNIDISRTDWDSFETSWDFKRHPLIPKKNDDII